MDSPVAYQRRILDDELDDLLAGIPAVALEGPKAVGKTATALQRVQRVLRLDIPSRAAVAQADPDLAVEPGAPLLVDEWQYVPAIWDAVKRRVDAGAPPGAYVLTGSASPQRPPMHSGAGRIVCVRMRPLSLVERGVATPTVSLRSLLDGGREPIEGVCGVGVADYAHEVVRSGFPGLRSLNGRAHRASIDSYLSQAVERDVLEQGVSGRQPNVLRGWLSVYAAATGTVTSLESLRDAAALGSVGLKTGVSKVTALGYHEALQRLWLLDPLPGWAPTRNALSRVSQAPRLHLADPALAVSLLGVDERALLEGRESPLAEVLPKARTAARFGPLLGQLFESLVTQSVRVYAQAAEARASHFRLHGGSREVDLIVERADQRVVAIEVKLASAIGDEHVAHLHWLKEKLGPDLLDAVVISTGSHAYRRPDGIAVVPAGLLGP